jgi:hypothetical protein
MLLKELRPLFKCTILKLLIYEAGLYSMTVGLLMIDELVSIWKEIVMA